MNLVLDDNAHACILALASDPCLFPGEHLRDRIHFSVKRGVDTDAFGTWLAAGSEWVTISKYHGATLVFVASRDSFYHAAPNVVLSPLCPDKTVFIGQFIIEERSPRVLVHDLSRVDGEALQNTPARERYAKLQALGDFLGPICTVQWAGECHALAAELSSGRFKVPHAVRSVMALGDVPGKVSEIRV